MEEFYPSEIARLVLGYLKETECLDSWKTFLQESFDLREHYRLYTHGKIYSTNVNGKSLRETLREYCAFKNKTINKDDQSNCSKHNCNYEAHYTPNKVSENAKVTANQMVQTSASIPTCQTPKRNSNCRATRLSFDGEADLNGSFPYDNIDEDVSSHSDSVPNFACNRKAEVSSNSHSKSVMTLKPNLCDTSVQTDLNYKSLNNCSKGIQTENLCLCPPSLSKVSQETVLPNAEKILDSCSAYSVRHSSYTTVSAGDGCLQHDKHNSEADIMCDNVAETSVSTPSDKSLSKIDNYGENYVASEKIAHDRSQSQTLSEVSQDKYICVAEVSSKSISEFPLNSTEQTETPLEATIESMDVDDATLRVGPLFPTEDLVCEKNSNTSEPETSKLTSKETVSTLENDIEENCRDRQNISNVSIPDVEVNVINKATEHPEETSSLVQVNELSCPVILDPENNSQEVTTNSQEIAKSTSCELLPNISAPSTESANENGAFCINISASEAGHSTNYSVASTECSQECNLDFNAGVHRSNLDCIKSLQDKDDNAHTFANEARADVTSDLGTLEGCSHVSDSIHHESKVQNVCLSDLGSAESKIQNDTFVKPDLISTNSNIEPNSEVTKLDARDKDQLNNAIKPKNSQPALNNSTESNLPQMGNTGTNVISVNDQTKTVILPSLPVNKPSCGLAVPNPVIPTFQSVPSISFSQNNSQCQYFMFLPVQTVPTVNVINPVVPPPVTAVTDVHDLNVPNEEKIAITSASSGRNSGLISSPAKQDVVIVPSPVKCHTKGSGRNSGLIGSPAKQDVVIVPSPVKCHTNANLRIGKQAASFITSSPIQENCAFPDIKTPTKKIKKASKKKKGLTKQKPDEKKNKSNKGASKQNSEKNLSLSGSSTSVISEKSILPCSKSSRHSNQFITASKIIDQGETEKECRTLKVLLSDVLKSTQAQCLNLNAHSTSRKGKNKNNSKESLLRSTFQPVENSEESNQISCDSYKTYVHKKKKVSKNKLAVTSPIKQKIIDSSDNKSDNYESLHSCGTSTDFNKAGDQKDFAVFVEKYSEVPNIEELNSESISSTDALVTKIATAIENCFDDVPEKIEVVVLSDTEESNVEGENIDLHSCVSADKELLSYTEDTDKQNLDNCFSEKETGSYEPHQTNSMSKENVAECENIFSVLRDSDCEKNTSSEQVMDFNKLEQSDVAFQSETDVNISSNKEKICAEKSSADIGSIKRQIVSKNFEVPSPVCNDLSFEREDLDSSRTLMINTSPYSEEEDIVAMKNSHISSDDDSLQNKDFSDSVNKSHCSNFRTEEISNDIIPPSNTSDNNENTVLLDLSDIHNGEKHTVSPNTDMNVNVEATADDEHYRHFELSNYSKGKSHLHLPQGIIDSVKYFNSQPKLLTMRKHMNVTTSVNNAFLSKGKETSKQKDMSMLDLTLNSLQTAEARRCKSVAPYEIINIEKRSESASNENSKISRLLTQPINSSTVVEKHLNNDTVSCAEKKSVLYSNLSEKMELLSSRFLNIKQSVIDNGSPHLCPNGKDNDSYGAIAPFKKRIRHRSYDSSVPLSAGQTKVKSKNAKSLENLANVELYIETNSSEKCAITDAAEKSLEFRNVCMSYPTSELKAASVNIEHKTTDPLPVNLTCDSNHHAKFHLLEDNSLSPAKVQAINSENLLSPVKVQSINSENSLSPVKVQSMNSQKFSAKRHLLEENSDSDSDLIQINDANTEKFYNKRLLLEKDVQIPVKSHQKGKFSAKKQFRKRDLLPPGKVQQLGATDISTIRTLEWNEIQSKCKIQNIPRLEKFIQSVEENKAVTDYKQTSCRKLKVSPKKRDTHSISKSAVFENFGSKNKDFSCSTASHKRKSSDNLVGDEYSTFNSSNQTVLSPEKNHFVDENELNKNNSSFIKRQKLSEISSISPEKGSFNNAFEQDVSHLSSNKCSSKDTMDQSSLLLTVNPESNSIVESMKNCVTAIDSPVRHPSKSKKAIYKSALRKRIEKDPNIPAGVKIPSKWNRSKLINYSHAIGHSLCDYTINPKRNNTTGKKVRKSRPTLKIATIQSPSKEILNKKNFPPKICSENCLSEGPTSRNTVCNWVSKEKNEERTQKIFAKKTCSRKSIKLGSKKTITVSQSTDDRMVASISEIPLLKAPSQVSEEEMLTESTSINNSVINHCETTQDIVEADIGRSDEDGSELANAIAGVEKELLSLPSNSNPGSPEDELSPEKESTSVSDSCEQEGTKYEIFRKFIAHDSKFKILMDKIESIGVDKVLEKIDLLEAGK